jgi:hypothetical protein
MELIIIIVTAFPIGFFIRSRTAAYITFVAIHGFVFTFQSLDLIIEWTGGSKAAFGPYPKAKKSEIWSYGVVNVAIFAAGLGLVALGYYTANRRRTKATTLNLDPARRASSIGP